MAAIYNPSTDTSSSTAYIVTLIVTDDVGDEYSVKKHVDLEAGIVRSLPHAEFTYSISDTTVLFDASNSYDLDGGIISTYEWHFGDGSAVTVTQPTVSHKYTTYGPFTVSLKVTNSIGVDSSTVRRVIEDVSGGISKDLCFDVRFNEDNNGYVYFDATCTPGISEDHNMVWNFGDGSGDTPGDAIVSHKYISSGDYTVSVRTPNYNSLSKQITVNIAPYMNVYIDYNPWEHLSTECEEALTQTVILEARNPRYTGTLISEWEAIPTDEFSEYETVIFTKEGEVIELDLPEVINYRLRYRLTDDTGLYSSWDYAPPANLYIQPSVDFTYKVDPTTYTVYFDASSTTFECGGVSLGTITSYNWDFGNGMSNIGETPSVVYNPLRYNVSLEVETSPNDVIGDTWKWVDLRSIANPVIEVTSTLTDNILSIEVNVTVDSSKEDSIDIVTITADGSTIIEATPYGYSYNETFELNTLVISSPVPVYVEVFTENKSWKEVTESIDWELL